MLVFPAMGGPRNNQRHWFHIVGIQSWLTRDGLGDSFEGCDSPLLPHDCTQVSDFLRSLATWRDNESLGWFQEGRTSGLWPL